MAHCTGCGLWLGKTELFCGICGLERADSEPQHRAEHVVEDESSGLTESAASDATASVLCRNCGWPTAGAECLRCGYGTPAQFEPRWRDDVQELGWRRALDYVATVVLWVLLVVALGAMFEGAAAFVAVALGSLGLAAAIRGFYAWTGNRPFMSPWLFALAAVFAFFSVIGQATRHNDVTATRGAQRGISTAKATATPVERQTSECVKALMSGIRRLPASKRAFSIPDSRVYANRYCDEAVRMGLVTGTSTGNNRQAITALQAKVVKQLLASGKIKLLP